MKGREGKGATSTDLLVCFPSRAHLTLMPKSICSPARPSEPNKRFHHHHHLNHHHHLKKSITSRGNGGAQASPLLWARTKPTAGTEMSSEPTSPKVTCAGQIKVRHRASKNWQSVMEEIERIHNHKQKHKKKPAWVEALGFKKEIMQFLTCLRTIRFDFRCFGAIPQPDITTDDEDEDEDDNDNNNDHDQEDDHDHHHQEEGHDHHVDDDHDETSRTVFSKWFMVLQDNQNRNVSEKEEKVEVINSSMPERSCLEHDDDDDVALPCAPPPNALLLMRCRSAPAKSLLEERQEEEEEKEEEEDEEDDDEDDDENENENEERDEVIKEKEDHREVIKKSKLAELFFMEEEMMKKQKIIENNLVVMRYDTDFYKLSSDIAKETWVVGGIRDPFARSRSWKR